ncbi:MAG: hypothetical protein M1826_003807 [Phylliscum demangeonii]|nr:MAG: hypothetical protein M1826_003807 [Phylliscum demangeonii]
MAPHDALDTDVVLSIHPPHVANIISRTKNHEFRRYLLPSTVRRLWIYVTRPISAIRYVAIISAGKSPGQLGRDNLSGLRNAEFESGELTKAGLATFAYEILELHQLMPSLRLEEAKSMQWLKGPPQKYNFAKRQMVEDLEDKLVKVFPLDDDGDIVNGGALMVQASLQLDGDMARCASAAIHPASQMDGVKHS